MNGLVNVIHEPTHFTANSSSSIDPILVSDTIRTIESGIIPIDRDISDHDCTYIEIDCRFKLSKCFKRVVWDYKHGDYERFRQQVSDTDRDTIINDDDTTNNLCINFTNKFLTIAKESIPLKTILVRHNDKSWISSELKKEIKKRYRLRQKFLRLKTLSTEQKYKSQRNKVNNIKKTVQSVLLRKK